MSYDEIDLVRQDIAHEKETPDIDGTLMQLFHNVLLIPRTLRTKHLNYIRSGIFCQVIQTKSKYYVRHNTLETIIFPLYPPLSDVGRTR